MEKFVFNKIGEYKSDWALTYVDPNNSYSAGGGRLTVVLSSYTGSAFFSHVGQPTFKEFIAQCDAAYLLKKLFPNVEKWVDVEEGEEVIEYIAINKLSELKEGRSSGEIEKILETFMFILKILSSKVFQTYLTRSLLETEPLCVNCLVRIGFGKIDLPN